MKSSTFRCSFGKHREVGIEDAARPSSPRPAPRRRSGTAGPTRRSWIAADAGLRRRSAAPVVSTPSPKRRDQPMPVTTTRLIGPVSRSRPHARSPAAAQPLAFSEMKLTASPTVWMCSAASSGNLDAELFFERHHQLDGVQAVGAQIVDEGGLLGHLAPSTPRCSITIFLTRSATSLISCPSVLRIVWPGGLAISGSRNIAPQPKPALESPRNQALVGLFRQIIAIPPLMWRVCPVT